MKQQIDRKGVKEMFNGIARHYDFLNHFLSLGTDVYWRSQVVAAARAKSNCRMIVDMATGTGDLALALHRALRPDHLIGLDCSPQMLAVARRKTAQLNLTPPIEWREENCEQTSLDNNQCDLVTIGFGIRNFEHPETGVAEAFRILKPGGQLIILEFSTPRNRAVVALVKLYFNHILPAIGRLISRHPNAYTYLPETIYEFPNGTQFCRYLENAGFEAVRFRSLTFNLVNIYRGTKPASHT